MTSTSANFAMAPVMRSAITAAALQCPSRGLLGLVCEPGRQDREDAFTDGTRPDVLVVEVDRNARFLLLPQLDHRPGGIPNKRLEVGKAAASNARPFIEQENLHAVVVT